MLGPLKRLMRPTPVQWFWLMVALLLDLGPLLLARLLDLNEVQTGVLNIIFRIADDQGLLLLTLGLTVLADLTIAIGVGVGAGLALRLARRDVPSDWTPPAH